MTRRYRIFRTMGIGKPVPSRGLPRFSHKELHILIAQACYCGRKSSKISVFSFVGRNVIA
jgi:hypothetical protein